MEITIQNTDRLGDGDWLYGGFIKDYHWIQRNKERRRWDKLLVFFLDMGWWVWGAHACPDTSLRLGWRAGNPAWTKALSWDAPRKMDSWNIIILTCKKEHLSGGNRESAVQKKKLGRCQETMEVEISSSVCESGLTPWWELLSSFRVSDPQICPSFSPAPPGTVPAQAGGTFWWGCGRMEGCLEGSSL